ncbi:MAG: outer membrane protein assembly factor BamD [Deltaproteobacteria bacterium]|nr:outer membrane protein assembly factor BamD [Deltaproteobacteria bacterium]
MSDPVRLLGSSRDGVARALLESAAAPDPTDAQCDALFESLARRLPVVVAAGAAGAAAGGVVAKAATSKAVGLGLFAKGAIAVGIAASVAGVAGTVAWRAREAAPPHVVRVDGRPSAPAPIVPVPRAVVPHAPVAPVPERVAPPPEPVVSDPKELPSPAPVRLAPPRRAATPPMTSHAPAPPASTLAAPTAMPVASPSPAVAPPPPSTESPLRAESDSLLRARRSLRSGDCSAALTELGEGARRFPGGALAQEREVLAIEALACTGRTATASARAEAFLRDYPTSPHASAARRFVR